MSRRLPHFPGYWATSQRIKKCSILNTDPSVVWQTYTHLGYTMVLEIYNVASVHKKGEKGLFTVKYAPRCHMLGVQGHSYSGWIVLLAYRQVLLVLS